MADILIRGVDAKVVARLKLRAKRQGRSLQREARLILERAAGESNVRAILERWQDRLSGRRFGDSAAAIRAERSR